MSQTQITSFYNSRKRPASDDLLSSKSKIAHITQDSVSNVTSARRNLIKNNHHNSKDVPALPKDCKLAETPALATLLSPTKKQQEEKSSTVLAKKSSINAAKIEPSTSQGTISARKELSLGDIRKKLSSSSRLAELKATAERLSRGIKQLKDASDRKNLKEFKSIDVEVPASPSKKATLEKKEFLSPNKKDVTATLERPIISPRKVMVSPIKSPTKISAYIKQSFLPSTASSLPLPHQYRFLAELFRGMETVVAMLYNRNEKITFNKLKPSVQEMLKRNFTEKHLAQIKQLVPDFYKFETQKIKTFVTSSHKETYELVITPNFPIDIKIMNPNVLLERRRYFYNTLLQLAKRHHSQYLLTLDPPMSIPDDKLTRWHPDFEIEKVPEVECAKLPEMPNVEKLSTAQDVLSKARDLFKCNTKMERALEKLAQAQARGLTEEEKVATGFTGPKSTTTSTQTSEPLTSGITILNPALRNLPASLLEKVKAKQAAKALEAMTRSSQYEEKHLIYSRLPDLSKTLRNIFVTERKNVLALNIILSKLETSFKANISPSDLQRDIKELSAQAPEFVTLLERKNVTYVKLCKDVDLKKVVTKLEMLAEKYKSD